jgi:hypothetical protein
METMTTRALHGRERTGFLKRFHSFAPLNTGLQFNRTNRERTHSFVFGSFARALASQVRDIQRVAQSVYSEPSAPISTFIGKKNPLQGRTAQTPYPSVTTNPDFTIL